MDCFVAALLAMTESSFGGAPTPKSELRSSRPRHALMRAEGGEKGSAGRRRVSVFRRGSRPCAERDHLVDHFLALVEHDELMFGLDQAAGHGKAHLPKADESDVHGGIP